MWMTQLGLQYVLLQVEPILLTLVEPSALLDLACVHQLQSKLAINWFLPDQGAGVDAVDSKIALTCSDDGGATYTKFANFIFDKSRVDRNSVDLKFFQVDNLKGTFNDASLTVTTDTFLHTADNAATFNVTKTTTTDPSTIGCIAGLDTKLYDTDKFWDASGNFILENPQTITMTQGDGKSTSFTIYGSDTYRSVRDKMNEAIGTGLGQTALVGCENADKFVCFVTSPCTSGLEAVKGTFVIRSAVAGKDGEINFVGADNVLSALSLTTIQCSVDNNFYVDVTEAHKLTSVASCVKNRRQYSRRRGPQECGCEV